MDRVRRLGLLTAYQQPARGWQSPRRCQPVALSRQPTRRLDRCGDRGAAHEPRVGSRERMFAVRFGVQCEVKWGHLTPARPQ